VNQDFLGRGWRFPFAFDRASGGVATSAGEQDIRACIALVLGTRPGERPMNPDFGCRAHEVLYQPNTQGTASVVAWHVRQALARHEPRIEVVDVDARADGYGKVSLQVRYRIRATAAEQVLALELGGR
jgi:phage baseplate assembly protein W